MMNKRRTKEIGRTKYLMFLPLAAILMIVSNIEMVARTTEKFAKEMMGQATKEVAMQAETTDIPELPTEDIQGTTLPLDKQGKEMTETQIKKCTRFRCLPSCRRNARFSGRSTGTDGLLVEECQISG